MNQAHPGDPGTTVLVERSPIELSGLLTAYPDGSQPALAALTPEGIQGHPVTGHTKIVGDASDYAVEIYALVGQVRAQCH